MKTKRNHFCKAEFLILLWGLFLIILPYSLKSQDRDVNSDEEKGLQLGLNFGMYLPNNYPANYYNGSDGNENNIKYIFSNKYLYEDIYRALNASDTFFLYAFPMKMRYPATVSPGVYFSYNFNRTTGVFVQFNYVKLKPHNAFTIEVDPKEYLTTPDLRLYSISGEEERINIDIGYSRAFRLRDNIDFVGEAGVALNDIKVLKSRIYIENTEYSLINVYGKNSYIPNSNQQTFEVYLGGIGIGMHGGAGLKFNFSESIALQTGATFYWNNVNLEGYKDMSFSSFFYLRFIAKRLI